MEFNQEYFFNRSKQKNALAISSKQSKPITSYQSIKENYNLTDDCVEEIHKSLLGIQEVSKSISTSKRS